MYSLNAPLPSRVTRLAAALARDLGGRARARDEHTLVVKRLGTGDRTAFQRLSARVREVLSGTQPVEARVTGVDSFAEPAAGTGPVVYLAVESPGLARLHDRLCEHFDPVEGVEADDYVPHVTVARGGSVAAAERLADRDIDPVTWTVSELLFWDAERSLPAGRVSLPA